MDGARSTVPGPSRERPARSTMPAMSAPDTGVRSPRVLVGYDGSPSAVNAIEAAAALLPSATASILDLWEPPFTSPELRHRVMERASNAEALGQIGRASCRERV